MFMMSNGGAAVGGCTFLKVEQGEAPEPITICLPTKPYTLIDAVNRAYAAQGSPRMAAATSSANYNGHYHVGEWNNYRQYYVLRHTWAGSHSTFTGTDARELLRAGLQEWERGGLGTTVTITLKAEDSHLWAEFPQYMSQGEAEAEAAMWQDERFAKVGDALWAEKHFGIPAPSLLIQSATVAEYTAKCEAWHEERRARIGDTALQAEYRARGEQAEAAIKRAMDA